MLSYIPPPPGSVLHVGPLPLRAYALCIITGIAVAGYIADKRWLARGGKHGTIADIVTISIPFGLVGARIWHVATDPELYFGKGKHPIQALEVWHGGLGIWGTIGGGAIGVYWLCRRRGINFAAVADAAAPGIAVAQAIGRWGNYFNQELFGSPSHLPWALRVDPSHRPTSTADVATYHPTFLYESIWNLGVAGLVLWADRRWRLGGGRAFALYVAAYTAGRAWIEALRSDQANHILGLRLNDWTSIILFVGAVIFLYVRRNAGREVLVEPGATPQLPPGVEADAALQAAGEPDDTVPAPGSG